jgi:FAD synthase
MEYQHAPASIRVRLPRPEKRLLPFVSAAGALTQRVSGSAWTCRPATRRPPQKRRNTRCWVLCNAQQRRIIVPGKFDALHIGHRELVLRAASYGKPVILTFSGMAEVLGRRAQLPIVARTHMEHIIRNWFAFPGRDADRPLLNSPLKPIVQDADAFEVVVVPFAEIRHLSPEDFIVQFLYRELGAGGIVCGWDWRFGYRAAGDVALLKSLSAALGRESPSGWVFETVPPVLSHGDRVSSSTVRRLLAAGRIHQTTRMLDRFHACTARCTVLRNSTEFLELCVDSWENQPPAPSRLYECRVELRVRCNESTIAKDVSWKRLNAYVWIESSERSESASVHGIAGAPLPLPLPLPRLIQLWTCDRMDVPVNEFGVSVTSDRGRELGVLERALCNASAVDVTLEFRSVVTASKPVLVNRSPLTRYT